MTSDDSILRLRAISDFRNCQHLKYFYIGIAYANLWQEFDEEDLCEILIYDDALLLYIYDLMNYGTKEECRLRVDFVSTL